MRWQWRQEQSKSAVVAFNAQGEMISRSRQFFLKTATPAGQPESPYADLYLRHHGSGINSVVLTASPPRFIKSHIEDDGGRIAFTSASHEGRKWGLVLCRDGERLAGWERVEIVEDGGSDDFVFNERESDGAKLLESEMKEEEDEKVWKGWVVCEWSTGHPQLFWVTHKLKGALPDFCTRVDVVQEMLK